jgi:hypothetical protein
LVPSVKPFRERGNVWTTRARERVTVPAMSDAHLVNTVRMLYRKGYSMDRLLVMRAMINELCRRGLFF